jgi:hypothetical protein
MPKRHAYKENKESQMTEAQGYFVLYALFMIVATMNKELAPVYLMLNIISAVFLALGIIKSF